MVFLPFGTEIGGGRDEKECTVVAVTEGQSAFL